MVTDKSVVSLCISQLSIGPMWFPPFSNAPWLLKVEKNSSDMDTCIVSVFTCILNPFYPPTHTLKVGEWVKKRKEIPETF